MSPDQVPAALVITMWEQYGSGMTDVADRVGRQLSLPVTGQAFSSEDLEAQEEAEERNGGFLDRLAAVLGAVPSGLSAAKAADVNEREGFEQLVADNRALVLSMAAQGGIILGHDATKILAGRPNTLHVKFVGPVEERVARAAADRGIGTERARRRQEREDRVRVEMADRFNRWDPRGTDYWDLIVNTTTLGTDGAADLVVRAAGRIRG
ncbi:cytidylate kinase family protein [Raineyella fluvialis]|nr:cytidylate kinase family protein [Raineyella fluvialis]